MVLSATTAKRYAIVGTGIRGLMFAQMLAAPETRRAGGELVGLVDPNQKRLAGFCACLGESVPGFGSLTELCRELAVDGVVIASRDDTHAALIEEACGVGLEVVVEKPMATTCDGVWRVRRAARRGGRPLRVGFNLRFMPVAQKIKSLLVEGVIGEVVSGSVDWMVDRTHGMDYFRRWHAEMAHSGGLLVHKASHHFDLLNWFLDDRPVTVAAMGGLRNYGPNGAYRGERCSSCAHTHVCDGAMPTTLLAAASGQDDAEGTQLRRLYYDAEGEDGYIRDRCVYRADIDIYDTMSVLIRYAGGAQINYSLNAANPYEGFVLSLIGREGRLEAHVVFHETRPDGMPPVQQVRVITGRSRGEARLRVEDMPVAEEVHDGADGPMMRRLLLGESMGEALGQEAGAVAGAFSALIGISANESIATGRFVSVPDVRGEALSGADSNGGQP